MADRRDGTRGSGPTFRLLAQEGRALFRLVWVPRGNRYHPIGLATRELACPDISFILLTKYYAEKAYSSQWECGYYYGTIILLMEQSELAKQPSENQEPLVDLSGFGFILEPVYFQQGFSPDKRMFLRQGAAEKLQAIQNELKIYKFKIWDGFRPRQVQYNIYKNLWNTLRPKHPEWDTERMKAEMEIFIANPYSKDMIPPHSTGGAVDLTLMDLSGKELDMGTDFDYFGPEAEAGYYEKNNINQTVRQNRELLREAMEANNFTQYENEWWHFDYGNQPWATKLNKTHLLYGEAPTPE